jgi:hypothetical protein
MCSNAAARLAIVLAMAAAFGCGAANQTPSKASLEVSVSTLYPLIEGAAWSYDVDSGDGHPVLATTRVLHVRDGAVEVASGQALIRYTQTPEGIARAGSPGYLLKAPLLLNASWPSAPDTVARVDALHQRVTTAAGSFDECVLVKEQNAGSGQRVTTTYCPGVGPTTVISEMEVRGHALRVTATLRGYALPEPASASHE